MLRPPHRTDSSGPAPARATLDGIGAHCAGGRVPSHGVNAMEK
jgi:hypothetical protein